MDLSNAPADLLKEITRHMDTADRSSWRLVSKAARQAVYDSTTALARCNDMADSTAALLPQLVAKCSGLKQLSCKNLPHLNSIAGLLQLPLRLEALDISHTDVADLSFIARCTSLRRLNAENVPGCAGPRSRQLPALLQQLPGLTALQLRDNWLCEDAACDVAAVLHSLTDLEELDIGSIGLGAAAAAALLQAVPHLKRLRLLDLRSCRLGGHALLPAVLQLSQLEYLDLSGTRMATADVSALAPAVQQLPMLRSLGLGINFAFENPRSLAPALSLVLGHLTRLQDLHLYCNGLGPEGAALLAPTIQGLTGLLRLDLRYNNLGAGGVAALAPALQRLTLLQRLYLGYNALGPDGLPAVVPAIQQLVSLRCLDLRQNALDRDSILLFAVHGINQLSKLEELHVCGNGLDDECGQMLAYIMDTSSPGCKVYCT